jgi:D-alanyl-D-alanine carboxypeptidase
MTTIKKILLLLPLIFIFSSCKENTVSTGENVALNQSYISGINNIADSVTTKRKLPGYPDLDYSVPGIVISVWVKDKNFSYAVARGKADISTGRALKVNDLFRIGSITKTFVITVLLQLVDEGKISLDDKLSKFYPDYPDANKVTIRMLGNMSSGIFNYLEDIDFNNLLASEPLHEYLPADLVNYGKAHPYYFEPGAAFHYTNTATTIVGMIIEKLTGNKLENEVKTRIIDKLNLKNTFFPTDRFMPAGFSCSKGYTIESLQDFKADVTEKYSNSWLWAAGGMISNAEDLKIWAEALAEGKLISANMQKERLITVSPCFEGVPIYDKAKYGLGIMNVQGFIGHGGDILGYHTYMTYDPVRKAGAIVLLNYDGEALNETYAVLKILYPEI